MWAEWIHLKFSEKLEFMRVNQIVSSSHYCFCPRKMLNVPPEITELAKREAAADFGISMLTFGRDWDEFSSSETGWDITDDSGARLDSCNCIIGKSM